MTEELTLDRYICQVCGHIVLEDGCQYEQSDGLVISCAHCLYAAFNEKGEGNEEDNKKDEQKNVEEKQKE